MVLSKRNIKALKQLTVTLKELRLLKKYSDVSVQSEIDLIVHKIQLIVQRKSPCKKHV